VKVLDASALLAFLREEPGAVCVERALEEGAACGAANWSEVIQKIRAAGGDEEASEALLATYGLVVEPVTREDGAWAARRWRLREGLSLADRLCLALGHRLDCEVLTADAAWGSAPGVLQIR
jgi:PIN domain nuclease of toxin-antitoxin system